MNWYYADQGQQKGPIGEAGLDELVRAGLLSSSALVWREGMADWKPYSTIKAATAPLIPVSVETIVVPKQGVCVSCGREVPAHEVIVVGESLTCADCKPVFVERLREADMPNLNLPGAMRYSSFWIRYTARMADYTLLTLVQSIFTGTGIFWAFGRTKQPDVGELFSTFGFTALLGFAVSCLYETVLLSTRGATVGKMLCYIRVVRPDGSPIGVGTAIGRYFAELISRFTAGIGLLMAAFDVERRSMHDRIAGTRVVDVPPPDADAATTLHPVSREICCEKCHTPIPDTEWNALDPLPCTGCGTRVQAIVFPAIARSLSSGVPHPKEGDAEAGCFYHDTNRAIITCEACGRFLCALCDCDAGSHHLCPGCFQAQANQPTAVQRRTLYDSIALAAAVIPNLLLVTIYFTFLTAPGVIGFTIWSWNKQGSVTSRGRWRFIVALIFAALNIFFVGAVIVALVSNAFK